MLSKLLSKCKGVRDPVCGKSVPKEEAYSYQFVGDMYYFCSDRCRERFQMLPARYLETPIRVTDSSPTCGC